MTYNGDGVGWNALQDRLKDIRTGEKWKDASFQSEKKLNSHISSHLNQYEGFTPEQYVQRARNLLATPVQGTIEGFTNSRGWRFRYDNKTNDCSIGRPDGHISTLFKPDNGSIYWKEQIVLFKDVE